MPRVVSGIAKSIILNTVKGMETRPTADKVKESVFNILSSRIIGSKFLDLYAGTGQMGIEALSRYAIKSTFIDNSPQAIECIRKNLEKTKLYEKSQIINKNILNAIRMMPIEEKYEIIYIDPPFANAKKSFREIVNVIIENDILSDDVILILEHNSKDTPDETVINLKLKRSCKYGSVVVSFYEKMK